MFLLNILMSASYFGSKTQFCCCCFFPLPDKWSFIHQRLFFFFYTHMMDQRVAVDNTMSKPTFLPDFQCSQNQTLRLKWHVQFINSTLLAGRDLSSEQGGTELRKCLNQASQNPGKCHCLPTPAGYGHWISNIQVIHNQFGPKLYTISSVEAETFLLSHCLWPWAQGSRKPCTSHVVRLYPVRATHSPAGEFLSVLGNQCFGQLLCEGQVGKRVSCLLRKDAFLQALPGLPSSSFHRIRNKEGGIFSFWCWV